MELPQIARIVKTLIAILLLGLTYTYLDKLERLGCACSVHPYRNFIKIFSLVAIVYLLITMVFPPSVLAKTQLGMILSIIDLLFALAFIAYLVMAIIYVRYLQKEKCKCSEDLRREILYIVSILELLFLFTTVLIGFIVSVTASAVMLAMTTVKDADKLKTTVISTVRDPVGAVERIPASFKRLPKEFKKNLKFKKN